VLSARAAVLRQFVDDGWLDLPRRRMSGSATGLSGELYEVWVDAPPEKVHLSSVNYRDRAFAILTLADGRQLRVQLTGTLGEWATHLDADDVLVPTIFLDVGDSSVSGMTPVEIRQRLSLLPDTICWRGHWDDSELLIQANAAARAEAERYLDEVPEGLDLPPDLPPTLRRESVLHFEVKKILEQSGRLAVPSLGLTVEGLASNGTNLSYSWGAKSQFLGLTNVVLEHRLARIIPDVVCDAHGDDGRVFSPLFVEVTVTNQIDDMRLGRIPATRSAALEIDLSLTGGRLTRDQLRVLVVDDLNIKRWLYHPDLELHRELLNRQLAHEIASIEGGLQKAARRRQDVLATPLPDIAFEYVDAVLGLHDAMVDEDSDETKSAKVKVTELAAKEKVADAADKLAIHGYPEAGDDNLIGWHGILARILSVQLDRGAGYRLSSGMAVLNAIRQTKNSERSNHTLYFIAARIYAPSLTPDQKEWLEQWIAEVKTSIRNGETTYLRDPRYDRLLSLLFPDMAVGLSKQFGKRAVLGEARRMTLANHAPENDAPRRRRAQFLESQPGARVAEFPLRDTDSSDGWLKGRDLEAWKKANPDAAASWKAG